MSRRVEKVAALLQQQAAAVLVREFSAQNVAVTVTRVDVSPDLKNANVYVSVVGDQQNDIRPRIEKAAPGMIARHLSGNASLRNVPHLHIVFDDSGEYSLRISSLMADME